MAAKTEAELLEEIKQKNEEIKSLEKEVKNLKKYKQYEDMANEMRALHSAFVNSGFDDDQAFELLKDFIKLGAGFANVPQKVSECGRQLCGK